MSVLSPFVHLLGEAFLWLTGFVMVAFVFALLFLDNKPRRKQ